MREPNNLFSQADIKQITRHGLSTEQVESQIERFKQGFDFLPISRAAVVGDGIIVVDGAKKQRYIDIYNTEGAHLSVVKFVPASGAATRMFKDLFEYITSGKSTPTIDRLVESLERFAFAEDLKSILARANQKFHHKIEDLELSDRLLLVKAIVEQSGLGYGSLPKALLLFHKYSDGECRSAMEEHLTEGAMYGSTNSVSRIHFTLSPEHREGFEALLKDVLPKYEQRHKVKYLISFSQQKNGTDTVAVTPENELFRCDDGSLLFRPAGHGALIENLNDIEADLIYIKTVDNVVSDRYKPLTVEYKKVLGGMMIELYKNVCHYLALLEFDGNNEPLVERARRMIEQELCYKFSPKFNSLPLNDRVEEIKRILCRPIRICGMVRNEGEPGGGPFWVTNADGSESLQIAESSQVSPTQMYLMREATHFNPVDLVCSVRDYRGNKFDLIQFVDHSTGFISTKYKDGRTLRAMELPGLWNGAMANWTTIFVEVPIGTFSPVKEVTDLLREEHQ